MIVSIYATSDCIEAIKILDNYKEIEDMFKEKGRKETTQFVRKYVDFGMLTIQKALFSLFDESHEEYIPNEKN